MNYKWYLMVLVQYMTILAGQYKLELLGIRWYRACMPVYIGKSGDLVGCY